MLLCNVKNNEVSYSALACFSRFVGSLKSRVAGIVTSDVVRRAIVPIVHNIAANGIAEC